MNLRVLRVFAVNNNRKGTEDAKKERGRRESEIIPVLMTREAQMTTNNEAYFGTQVKPCVYN